MKSFLFSLGDSSKGPVGFCARVTAETPEEAVKILNAAKPAEMEAPRGYDEDPALEYFIIYFGRDVTIDDIDQLETEDADNNDDKNEAA